MSDLISRQDAIDETKKIIGNVAGFKAWAILDMLSELPSAEPEPSQVARAIATIIENEKDMRVISERKTGRWIADENVSRWKCSCCDGLALIDDYGQMSLTEYCPNCGAKMEVEHE